MGLRGLISLKKKQKKTSHLTCSQRIIDKSLDVVYWCLQQCFPYFRPPTSFATVFFTFIHAHIPPKGVLWLAFARKSFVNRNCLLAESEWTGYNIWLLHLCIHSSFGEPTPFGHIRSGMLFLFFIWPFTMIVLFERIKPVLYPFYSKMYVLYVSLPEATGEPDSFGHFSKFGRGISCGRKLELT